MYPPAYERLTAKVPLRYCQAGVKQLSATGDLTGKDRSQLDGFGLLRWGAGSQYEVRDGALYQAPVSDLGQVTSYLPAGRPEVATEFAKLHEGDADAVRKFAEKWGRLGYDVLLSEASIEPDEAGSSSEGEEPLEWIWAHARGVRICLQLADFLRNGDTKGIKDTLHARRVPRFRAYVETDSPDEQPTELGRTRDANTFATVYGKVHSVHTHLWVLGKDHQVNALKVIRQIVNANLHRLTPTLRFTDDKRGLKLGYGFTALIDAIWWHTARYVLYQDLARCEHCGNLFERRHGKERFCPPPEGSKESLCRRNASYHRGKDRAKGTS